MNKEDFKCNVLIMGKTGAGKSSLLNYLCDTNLAETGTGKPVTGEGIFEYPALINGQEIRIFDSWGIEAGKVDKWKTIIDRSLQEHGVQKEMDEWFHSVIYCIQAGGGRIENIDSEIIKKFLAEGYLVTVVLTKADQVREETETTMKSVLYNELKGSIPSSFKGNIHIISTCAEKKQTRLGETKPFGKEELQEAILDGWRRTTIERLPKHVVARLCEKVEEWEKQQRSFLASKHVSGVHSQNSNILKTINNNAQSFCKILENRYYKEYLSEALESCNKANLSLKSLFRVNIKIPITKIDNDDLDSKWRYFVLLSSSIIEMSFPIMNIPLLIIKEIQSKSANRILDERNKIIEHIQFLSNKMKDECHKKESVISLELQKAL